MKMRNKGILMAVALASMVAAAADRCEIGFQGVLTEMSGASVRVRNAHIAFRLYPNPIGDDALWGRTVAVQLSTNGIFNVVLSDSEGSPVVGSKSPKFDALADALAASTNGVVYVGMTVAEARSEISPRVAMRTVTVAHRALDASRAAADFTALGKISADSLAAGSAQVSGTWKAGAVVAASDVAADGALYAGSGVEIASGSAEVVGSLKANESIAAKSADAKRLRIGGSASVVGKMRIAGNLEVAGSLTSGGANAFLPVGTIALWNGSTVPAGWHICDGTEGTPNLIGRFVPCAGSAYKLGDKGGAASVTLTVEQMPVHSHSFSEKQSGYTGAYWDANEVLSVSHSSYAETATTSSVGGGKPHENRPRYVALYYIKKLR